MSKINGLIFAFFAVSVVFGSVVSDSDVGVPGKQPVHVFCGVGDHLWGAEREPIDSPAAITAMLEWMSETYKVKRMYWRVNRLEGRDESGQIVAANEFSDVVPLKNDYANWCDYVYKNKKTSQAALAAARKFGMELILYTPLFDHGVQPDVGIVRRYLCEDKIRIEHPEWCPLDRWGERRSSGPISFCYPGARKAVIEQLVAYIMDNGYDGVNFYTYVENLGMRYQDEFGFNQPIVDEFNKKYPDVNLRKDKLTVEHREYWYKCRGKFLTQFLRELHAELSARGKILSVIIDAKEPHYPQTWWSRREVIGTGKIYMDYERWVDEAIVDELWIQLGGSNDQAERMSELLELCKDTPVKVTVRAINPFHKEYSAYVKEGFTPVAVITWERNGIERVTLEPIGLETLNSDDWKFRVQTLDDIAQGKIKCEAGIVAAMSNDPHLLVRRKAMHALAAMKAKEYVPVIEKRLLDNESCVRIAAAKALGKVYGTQSAQRIIEALEVNNHFQFKLVSAKTLVEMKHDALHACIDGLDSKTLGVREVCVRSLGDIGRAAFPKEVYNDLHSKMMDESEDYMVRWWAIHGLMRCRRQLPQDYRDELISNWTSMLNNEKSFKLQLEIAFSLGYMADYMTAEQAGKSLVELATLFREYGDACKRKDAAYGWRLVGNSIMKFDAGKVILENMLKKKQDKWLAWVAYQVLYSVQKDNNGQFCLVDEQEAIENHNNYAPDFPGWRKW
jgi:hypothetical protein